MSYSGLRRAIHWLVHAFFRDIEVTGLEHVPARGGGIVVSWHPNGLIDPALLITQFPRRVVFGAREGLFRWPLLGALMRTMGTVPIRRAVDAGPEADAGQRRQANRQALAALATEVAGGSYAALFPEGMSHDEAGLARLKTGAAHLYYQAREATPAGQPLPVIVPAGLFYDRKHRFRSRVLVEFHPPLALPPELDVTPPPGETEEARGARARSLTALIERVLHDAVGATEDWATHNVLQCARRILAAERAADGGGRGQAGLRQEAREFAAVRAAYYRLRGERRSVLLRKAVERYDADLRNLRLRDEDLDGDPTLASRGLLLIVLLQALLVFALLPPVLFVGLLINGPAALLVRGLARLSARLRKDEATIKLLASVVLYPLTWIAAGIGGYVLHQELDAHFRLPDVPILAGVTVALLAMAGGVLALRYLELSRETLRSVRVRLTRWQRAGSVRRLKRERKRLAQAMLALEAGSG